MVIIKLVSNNLRWRKEWICSEIPINMRYGEERAGPLPGVTDLASAWGHIATKTNLGSRNNHITEKTGIHWACAEHQFWAISWHWLRLARSVWPAGFKSTCFWSSKVTTLLQIFSKFMLSCKVIFQSIKSISIFKGFKKYLKRKCWSSKE